MGVEGKQSSVSRVEINLYGDIHLLKSAGSSRHRLLKLNSIVDTSTATFSRFS